MCCWGENCAIFFITLGGLSAAVLAWLLTADFLTVAGFSDASENRINLSDGKILAVTAAILILIWLISTPFAYGVKWYRIQQVRGNSVHARSVFSCYSSFKRMGQIFRLNSVLMAKRLVFFIPAAAVLAAGIFLLNKIRGQAEKEMIFSISAVLFLMIAAGIFCAMVIFNMKYAAVPFLFALEPDKPPAYLIGKSCRIIKGHTNYLIETLLSLAVWLVPCIIIFPAIFIFPYLQMVYTGAINELILADGKNDAPSSDVKRGDKLAAGN